MTRRTPSLVAGVDYGSDSVRVSVIDAEAGAVVTTVSRAYPRWAEGRFCSPLENRFRQHPLDHLETLEACFAQIAEELGDGAIAALAIDATGSTPAPVDARGVPLALQPDFAEDPDAMFWLWKDRTSAHEAAVVDRAVSASDPDHTMYQGVYSSEWWWAKILRASTINDRVREHAVSWVEHADWLPNMLVGRDDVREFGRNACAAGHKALYSERLGGMIPRDVLAGIHPALAEVSDTFRTPPLPAGSRLGTLSPEWATRLRLTTDTVVGVGSLDAHAGGVGAGLDSRSMVKVMGTSTVDLFLTSYDAIEGRDLHLLCGIAEDSIVPGHLGGETSQAAFGDLFAWYTRMLAWPISRTLLPALTRTLGAAEAEAMVARTMDGLLSELEAEAIRRGPSQIVALDWINGRRYPDVAEGASAALVGLRIGHDAVDVYRSLVQAAVLGSKAIYQSLADEGLVFDRVVLVGGIAKKSPYICQSMADALDTEVVVCEEDEVCAAGAAMYAATAAGITQTIPEAQALMRPTIRARYAPSAEGTRHFDAAFADYRRIGRLVGELDDVLEDRSEGAL